jgi:hypothetical protein
MLCKYSDIFGNVKQGVHSIRLFDIAIIDLLMTILLAYIISTYFNKNFIIVLFVLFISGIILHRLFCVRTTIDKILFKDI